MLLQTIGPGSLSFSMATPWELNYPPTMLSPSTSMTGDSRTNHGMHLHPVVSYDMLTDQKLC
jgi:hypothetical protein